MKSLFLFLLLCTTYIYSQDLGDRAWDRSSGMAGRVGNHGTLIQGTVLMHDGSPATGITVHITGVGANDGAVTDNRGHFEFSNLPGGAYEVSAESGTLFARQSLMANMEAPEITLRFDDANSPQQGTSGSSISVQQFKVPDKARKEYEKAVEEAGKQNTEKALKKLSAALASFACYADALTLKSVLELSAGQPKIAADEAQHAIHCDGSNGKAYFVLGAAFNALGQHQDAIRTLNEGIRFQPEAWQPYYELGKSFLAMNRGSEAVSQLNRAAQLAKNSFPQIYVALASALMSIRDYANARAQLLLFLKMAPSNPDAGKIKTLVARIEAQMGSAQSEK